VVVGLLRRLDAFWNLSAVWVQVGLVWKRVVQVRSVARCAGICPARLVVKAVWTLQRRSVVRLAGSNSVDCGMGAGYPELHFLRVLAYLGLVTVLLPHPNPGRDVENVADGASLARAASVR